MLGISFGARMHTELGLGEPLLSDQKTALSDQKTAPIYARFSGAPGLWEARV